MRRRNRRERASIVSFKTNMRAIVPVCVLALAIAQQAAAQQESAARASAPFDPTGYWVSVVTTDWRYRMVTPGPGEYAGIPLNRAAKEIADAWDPVRDRQAQEECKSYGAAALMRVPGRLHITWADANTLKVEMDNGKQIRLLHFDATAKASEPAQSPSWQGFSVAEWQDGTLKVVTRDMRPGYIRKNGVPYSAQAELTEFWDAFKEQDGSERLVITSLLNDPVYLQVPYGFVPQFRKEPDGSKWDPTPCSSQ